MNKSILILSLFVILSFKSFSQIIFEKGYFINDLNQKTECLIKNIDWKNNPTKFEYKLSQDVPTQIADIQGVKEFGVYGDSKYIRALVNIDRSSDNINDLNLDRNPIFQKELLFLKTLIEGRATLYLYENRDLTRFFYKTNDSEIKQLVYKQYLRNNKIAQNNNFRQELLNELKNQEILVSDIANLKYSKTELEKLFIKYNKATNSDYINYRLMKKKDLFNLSIRPGLNSSDLKIKNSALDPRPRDYEYGNKINFRFGVEAELIFPFNKNKWSIIIEPTFQYYKSELKNETDDHSGGFHTSKVNYQSVELPIGLRHNFYLNEKSKIFANISYIIDFSNNSSIEFTRFDNALPNLLKISSGSNAAFGVGYEYKNRYSLEMQYQTKREILGDYISWSSSYETFSIIFGYTLF